MYIELADDEGLILFDLLYRYGDGRELKIQHAAERNALWALSAQLERGVVTPLATCECGLARRRHAA